jgi:hypothetical protein
MQLLFAARANPLDSHFRGNDEHGITSKRNLISRVPDNSRHPREGGDPAAFITSMTKALDSLFRGNDGRGNDEQERLDQLRSKNAVIPAKAGIQRLSSLR